MNTKKHISEEIADRFKSVIDALNLPRKIVAERIGLDNSDQLSSLANARVRITKVHAKVLYSEFGVNEEWILYGKGEPFPQQKIETAESKGGFEARRACKEQDDKLARMEMAIFKNQCPGFLDEFFEFIAYKYGPTREGIATFLEDYMNNLSHTDYRIWMGEKKQTGKSGEIVPEGNLTVNDK